MLSIVINLLLAVHILVSLLIILVTLMQRPKNEGLGAAFGGGMTQDLFGAQTTNVLQTITRWLGGIFFALTLLLSYLYVKQQAGGSTPLQQRLSAPTTIPATPTPAPATTPAPDDAVKTPAPAVEKAPEATAPEKPAPAPATPAPEASAPAPAPAPAPATPAPATPAPEAAAPAPAAATPAPAPASLEAAPAPAPAPTATPAPPTPAN